MALEAENVEEFWARVNATANEFSASPGEVKGGRWVRISGLQSIAGMMLNGKVGQLLDNNMNQDGRFPVQIDGLTEGKLIKKSNLTNVTNQELVKTYRIPSRGEDSMHKVILFPKNHSMFTECSPNGNSPALALCGLPLVVQKVEPVNSLFDRSDYDNHMATWLMIEPSSGFAPPEWQSYVGPVLVYRPGGLDFSSDDNNVTNEFLGALLDMYGDGPGFDPMTWLNQSFFQEFVRRDSFSKDLKHLSIVRAGEHYCSGIRDDGNMVVWDVYD